MPSTGLHVLFAGGGTGGHFYPNVAIAQRLRALAPTSDSHFLVSDRPGDAQSFDKLGLPYTASPARPLPSLRKPWQAIAFARGWRRAVAQALRLIDERRIDAVVATGGFVSGPAIVAAARRRIPRVLVNLDAIPGQANRRLAVLCTQQFSAYPTERLPSATRIGLPLRLVSIGSGSVEAARAGLELDPNLRTLFVTGATHGAESVIRTMLELVAEPKRAAKFEGWQIFHQCGTASPTEIAAAYAKAGVRARVVDYCDTMGQAWRAADLAVSRAGAGSVAEAWANGTPTVFLPNPYHADQHQRANVLPLVHSGGAAMVEDRIDPSVTVGLLEPVLFELMDDAEARVAMGRVLENTRPPDGAEAVARWLLDNVRTHPAM